MFLCLVTKPHCTRYEQGLTTASAFTDNGVYVIVYVCVLGNTTHWRPSNPIKGQIWVRVYQEVWTQTRNTLLLSLSLSASCLFIYPLKTD